MEKARQTTELFRLCFLVREIRNDQDGRRFMRALKAIVDGVIAELQSSGKKTAEFPGETRQQRMQKVRVFVYSRRDSKAQPLPLHSLASVKLNGRGRMRWA